MEISEILRMQVTQDDANGFPTKFSNPQKKYEQLTKDLVGLFGEIGEFSNIIKKINIKLEYPNSYDLDMITAENSLQEELIDAFIYLLRIAAILNVDLEERTITTINKNAARYASLKHG